MKTTFGPQRIMFPLPTVLVVTGTIEKANIVSIAWINMLTGKPPTLGISVGSKGFSAEQIIQNKHFSVNLASVEIMKEADFCGITSGKDTDKFVETGLTKMPSKQIPSPIIKECPVNIECILVDIRQSGRTYNFSGEILETHVDKDKVSDPGHHGSIDVMAVNPLIYYSGKREYRQLGQKVGDAYSIGKELK
ncbi:MAG: flavin reductase family protein [Bacteroidales bacterium]|nr:flavin reductase family protein [Bacteroidales bacterium]MCF8350018.1 flavin reductase family protein [Bacteroidales bacterium]MCF8376353.1 flavin reductase family protein [Bacteroidales bacterium]MCF8400519.1 flavin reductase family protein [Bacteroidales bacterium]